MQAIGSRDSLVLPCDSVIVNKEIERRHNRLHHRAQLATLCDSLVEADLTATAYRVALDTLARMLRRGSTTEAAGNEWIASRLHVGRNAVSSAYSALEAAGFLRRIAVKHRGAPTRTRLINVFASLIDGAILARFPATTVRGRQDEAGDQEAVQDETGGLVQSHAAACATISVGIAHPAHTDEPARSDGTLAAEQDDRAPSPIPRSKPFTYNHAIYLAMVTKVPEDIRCDAARVINGKAPPVDQAWGLSNDETEHYLALVPKPERQPRPQSPKPANANTLRCTADAPIAQLLWNNMERLTTATGSKTEAMAAADQIAFQVECAGLGSGDPSGGARAGVSLVIKGRWSTPRGYLASRWDGSVLRGLMGATTHV